MQLECHPSGGGVIACRIAAQAFVAGIGRLRFLYSLEGEIDGVRVPARRSSTHADGLWRHTCFEAFIRRPGAPGYLEFNFSPSGEWATYGFRAYREPDANMASLPNPETTCSLKDNGLELEAWIGIGNFWTPGQVLEVGLSAVLEARDGTLSYWALAHPSQQPDFHHPGSFVLPLAMDGAA